MPENKHGTGPDWSDPDDAPDLTLSEWAKALDKTEVRRGGLDLQHPRFRPPCAWIPR